MSNQAASRVDGEEWRNERSRPCGERDRYCCRDRRCCPFCAAKSLPRTRRTRPAAICMTVAFMPDRQLTFAGAIHEAMDICLERDRSVYLIGLGVPDPIGVFGTTK